MRCERGRVVLREGHHGESFYFIYSGAVLVQVEVQDPNTAKNIAVVENVINRGNSFGVSYKRIFPQCSQIVADTH